MNDQQIADSFISEINEITFELGLCYDINVIYVNRKDKKILVEFNYKDDDVEGAVFTDAIEEVLGVELDEKEEFEYLSALERDDYKDGITW
jgi:hypothetical protein